MKIGINASFLRKIDSGIGQVTVNFLRKLTDLKVEISNLKVILYLEEDTDLELPKHFEKKILQTKLYKRDDLIRKVIWEKFLLPKAVEKDECDVLLSLYQSATICRDALQCVSTGKNKKRAKHVMFVHDAIWKVFPEYINNSRKRMYYKSVDGAIEKVDKILTNSQHSKKDIAKYFEISEEEIEVIPIDCDPIYKNEIDKSKIAEVLKRYNLKPDESYIFYAGGFEARKNVDGLIEAYGKLWQSRDALQCVSTKEKKFPSLVLAGKFYPHLVPLMTDVPKKIEEVSKKYNIPKNKFQMIGFVDQEDLPYLHNGAKLFCFLSHYEGFGLTPLEAMSAGCPVVASNASSIPEVISEGSALLVDPKNTDEAVEAMRQILTDDYLRDNLIERGKENSARFSWKKFTREVLKTITSV